MKVYASLVGHLLIRTLERAQRIHTAMRCRAFTGEIRTLRELRIGPAEVAFTLGWSAAFALFRVWNVPRLLGDLVTGFAG